MLLHARPTEKELPNSCLRAVDTYAMRLTSSHVWCSVFCVREERISPWLAANCERCFPAGLFILHANPAEDSTRESVVYILDL